MKGVRLALAFLVVVACGWRLGDIRSSADHGLNSATYPVDFGGAQWLRAASGGSLAYLRTTFDLPAKPTRATLLIDADQSFRAFINGAGGINNRQRVRSGQPALTTVVDATAYLHDGINVLAFIVTNSDDRPPELRVRLTTTAAGHATDLTTSGAWRATTDVSLVHLPAKQPKFQDAKFDDQHWPQALAAGAPRPAGRSIVPPGVVDHRFDGAVITTARPAADFVVGTALTLPWQPTDGWIRVATNASYNLFLDGHEVVSFSAEGAQLGSSASVRLQLLDLGRWLHAGRNLVTVHVSDRRPTAIYVDGDLTAPEGSLRFATDRGWGGVGASDSGDGAYAVPPAAASSLGPLAAVWPEGTRGTVVTRGFLPAPVRFRLMLPLSAAVWVVAGWLVVAAIGWAFRGMRFAHALELAAVGVLPALVAMEVVRELARIGSSSPPFPYYPSTLLVLLGLTVAGPLAAILLARPEPAADRVTPVTAGEPAITPPGWPRRHARTAGIFTLAAATVPFLTYRLGYEPYWQDEQASIVAARAMRAHWGLPRLPSSLLYFKGELYHGLLAGVSLVAGWNPVILRGLSVVWYLATILAFGLLLAPTLAPGRRWLHVIATAIFATAPAELVWARDVRMYQQAQFFAVVFIAFFWRALTRRRTSDIAIACIALAAMYLSHEETFVYFPAVAACFVLFGGRPALRTRSWWWWGCCTALLIAVQYSLTKIHPPLLGVDLSNRPYVQFDTQQFWYYLTNVYFPLNGHGGALTVVSAFALVGTVAGIVRRDGPRMYLAVLVWGTILALNTIFTVKIPRYTFVTLPPLFLLGMLGGVDVLDGIRALGHNLRALRVVAAACAALGTLWMAVSLTGGFRDYGLAAARLTHTTYAHKYADYQVAAEYIAARIQPGDAFLTLATPGPVSLYLGRHPDGLIPAGNPRFLYLIERKGRVVDTVLGAPFIFTADDLQAVMATHHRIWLVTYPSTISDAPQPLRPILAQFTEVDTSYGFSVYRWSG